MKAEAMRLVRYGAVGVTNTLLTLVTYVLLTRAGLAAGPASALGFAVGAANGYVLNRSWTFRARGGPAALTRYVAVQALGALCSAAAVTLVSSELSLGKVLAECVVVPLVTLLTYTLARRLVFRSRLASSAARRFGNRRADLGAVAGRASETAAR